MKATTNICLLLIVAVFSGCASSQVAQLQREKAMLSSELAAKNARITDLEQETETLKSSYVSQKQAGEVLRKEKSTRADNIMALRREVRTFVKGQMQALSDFSGNRELLDYVGGELISRSNVSGNNLLLVDMLNAMPSAGALTGGRVLGEAGCNVRFCVLRPEKENIVLIWVSKPYALSATGISSITFESMVAVEKGDLMGLYCPQRVKVPFSIGTGDTRTVAGPIENGNIIPVDSLEKHAGRTYSFGVTGFLQ